MLIYNILVKKEEIFDFFDEISINYYNSTSIICMMNKKWVVLLFVLTSVYAVDGEIGIFWPWGEDVLGLFFWLAFWIALIALLYLMLESTKLFGPKEDPLEILKRRYANGEITRKEYSKMKNELR